MGYLIVDGNSLGYAGQHTKPLSVNGQPVHAVFYLLKMLKKVMVDHPQLTKPVVLWDSRADFRYSIYPEYKGNREDTAEKREAKEEYKSQSALIRQGLAALGVDQVFAQGFEADDLAGFFARRISKTDKKALLVTGDEDWCQLVNAQISWFDPRNSGAKRCNASNFEEFTGVTSVGHFLQAKALQGDTSDNITGVGGIGDKTAKAIMNDVGGLGKLAVAYDKCGREFAKEDLPPSLTRARKKINEFLGGNIPVFKRNMQLMDLCTAHRDDAMKEAMQIDRKAGSLDDFIDFCGELSFMSIIRQRDSWAKTFNLS